MLTYKGAQFPFNSGETWHDACARLGFKDALAAMKGGFALSLAENAEGDAVILTYADEEGRRVYERSLRFVMVLAARRIDPALNLRVENSLGNGILVSALGMEADDELVNRLELEMKKICSEALRFIPSEVSTAQAAKYFEESGRPDTARLLSWREKETIRLFECGGIKDYYYGEMAYDTSAVSVFGLVRAGHGFVVLRPDFSNPSKISRPGKFDKLLTVYNESNAWARILGVENAYELNELTASGKIREFIRVNEALMDMKIYTIARSIVDSGARLVLIAGPSSSGKTTFCNRLSIALRVYGKRPVQLSLDDYYLNRDMCPLDEDGKPDLECVEALDTDLINAQLSALLRGEEVNVPSFDFVTGKRSSVTHTLKVEEGAPILIEGIHGLNERLTSSIPRNQKFKVYISALINLNLDNRTRIRSTDARLVRRLVRDSAFRGTPVIKTLEMWDSVRRGEDKNIFPYQEEADAMINSALVYESAITKKYIYDKLLEVPPEHPQYSRARRLVKYLNYIVSADVEDELPLNSLLREFVGGSCFYR